MTGAADQVVMPAFERESGVLGVIEIHLLPPLGGVTALAIATVTTLVLIILPMTGIA